MTALTTLYGLDHQALAHMIAKEYGIASGCEAANAHKLRREVIAQRLRLYRDDSRIDFENIVNLVFEKEDVKTQRKKMIAVAGELNVSARITNEVASLYDQPAMRSFKGDDAATTKLRDRAAELDLDEVMQEAQRLTFLCNEVLLWQVEDEDGARALHIVTPDAFDAIPHPANKLRAVGYLIDAAPSFVPLGADKTRLKYYELWDDTFTYHLNSTGGLVGEPIPHGQARIPGALFHRRMPVDCLLDCRAGKDITSAHLGVGLLAIMVMRLAKSQGERQPVLQGNLANVAANQSMDGEKPLALPPDVVASILDTQTSPEYYLSLKKDKVTSIGLTHGISYDQFTNTDSSTGAGYVARRQKLTELRNEQRRRARVHEKLVVVLIGFKADGFRVDHQEQAVPVDAKEELELLKEKVKLGLDSVVAYLMRKDPDLTRADAILLIKSNVRDWAMLIEELRVINMPADADASKPGKSPEENGADNKPKDDGGNDGSGTPESEADEQQDQPLAS